MENEKPNFYQSNTIIDEKSLMLAVTNQKMKNWEIANVEFVGTNETWDKAF